MTLEMTVEEREAFLADQHVGIISIARSAGAPLTVPIWYLYEPGGEVVVHTGRSSLKAQLIRKAGHFSLCAQTEALPYRYVSVDGAVTAVDAQVPEEERRAMVHRYLPAPVGDRYLESTEAEKDQSGAYRMRPERWLTIDYGKLS